MTPERAPYVRPLCILLLSLGAIYVFRGALNLYFAQDDFRGLAAAAGVHPRHMHLWRYVSVQTFMDVFYPLFRDRSWPYHAVGLALHCINAGLLFWLLSRTFVAPAALIGASFFAVHPALFTALYWQSARADLLAATFALSTLLFAFRSGRERWLAIPWFALSLLSKEATLALPVVIALLDRWRGRNPPIEAAARTPVGGLLVALSLMSVIYLAYLLWPKEAGIRVGFDAEAAYAFDFGGSLLRNLLTYVGWTANLAMLRPGLRFVDTQDPSLFPFAVFLLLIAGALAAQWPGLRRRGWLEGLASFLLLLSPVLPLRNHAYHYYLYAPLMAAAFCLAGLADALHGAPTESGVLRPRNTRARSMTSAQRRSMIWLVAGAGWLALTWNGARLVNQMEKRPSPVYADLRGDPIVDRALIARRVIESLRGARIPNGTELVFVLRERIALTGRIARGSGETPPPPHETYPESNVRAALLDGTGVRALVPTVDSVSFGLDLGLPAIDRRYAVYAPTGEVEVHDQASIDSLLRSSWVTRW